MLRHESDISTSARLRYNRTLEREWFSIQLLLSTESLEPPDDFDRLEEYVKTYVKSDQVRQLIYMSWKRIKDVQEEIEFTENFLDTLHQRMAEQEYSVVTLPEDQVDSDHG